MKSSFNGEIFEIPGIAVDNFGYSGNSAYFLSHCHADHTEGLSTLTRTQISRSDNVFIYMSEISAAIVESHINVDLRRFIKPLKLGTTTISIPGDREQDIQETIVQVTLIPAGHCFGSVMFLFETPLKKILYTGDFRITENSASKMAQLHHNNKPIKVDALYVDTTFQSTSYDFFPKRSEVMDGVVREITMWLTRGEAYNVALVTSARYGYEDIFNKLYKRMKMKVYVDDVNWSLYSKFLDRLPGVTNNRNETRIHLCSKLKKYCKTCVNVNTVTDNILYINFTAKKWRNRTPEDLFVTRDNNVLDVCFSTHCSRSELVFFIEYLAPRKIVGFRDPYNTPSKATTVKSPNNHSSPISAEKEFKKRKKKVPINVLRKLFE